MPLEPELQMGYDQNSIPVSAKCSFCGEQMPRDTPRTMNSTNKVAWFAANFRLHVARAHLLVWSGKSRAQ